MTSYLFTCNDSLIGRGVVFCRILRDNCGVKNHIWCKYMARICGISVSDSVLNELIKKSESHKVKKVTKSNKTLKEVIGTRVTKNDLKDGDDDLTWLDDLVRGDRELLNAVVCGNTKSVKSDHKKQIARLALNRGLYSGRMREHFIQVRLFYYVEVCYPEFYADMYAIPNGGYRPMTTGRDMVAEGVKVGHPDINIDCANGRYFGLRLEVKSSIGKVSDSQKKRIEHLNKRGYKAVVGYGYAECKSIIDNYLSMSRTCLS